MLPEDPLLLIGFQIFIGLWTALGLAVAHLG